MSGDKMFGNDIDINGAENQAECCGDLHINNEKVTKLKTMMPSNEVLYELAELYKVFGESTRIKILYALFESEMCVCDISSLLDMSVSAISHQLAILKRARLVTAQRKGKRVFYSLADNHIRTMIGQGMEHIEEDWK